MKIERETIKYEIGSFHDINEILYRQKKKTIIHIMRYIKSRINDIYLYKWKKNREREEQIKDWQFHDIDEILYRQKKKTIFHIMRYIQNRKNDVYIFVYKWRLRETQSNMRLAISWCQWNIISPKEEDDISYHEIHPKQQKRFIYIYMKMKIERETIKYEIGNFMISMKYYIAKRRNRYFISWDTSKYI